MVNQKCLIVFYLEKLVGSLLIKYYKTFSYKQPCPGLTVMMI